jgi:flagellar biogenesis protein FliO
VHSSTGSVHSQGLELPRIAGALAIVIGLIFALQWGGRKLFRNGAVGRSTRAVQVLARAPLAPRQHVVLLRVGRRIIVVGDSGSQMNALCEITDADEIAALLGQLQDEKSMLPTRAFGALFSRAKQDMEDHQEDPAGDDAASEMPDPSTAETADDASISDTREEITGLMAKIRLLSTHFRDGRT